MKQGTVRVSEEFTKPDGNKKWISHERQYDMDTEDPIDVFTKAQNTVNTFAQMSNPVIPEGSLWQPNIINYPPTASAAPVISVERTSEDIRIAELIRDIYRCTEIDGENGLLTYNKLASTCQEAKLAFDVMLKKLAHGTIRESGNS